MPEQCAYTLAQCDVTPEKRSALEVLSRQKALVAVMDRVMLGWVGGSIVVVVVGLWATFKLFFSKQYPKPPPTVSASNGGVAAMDAALATPFDLAREWVYLEKQAGELADHGQEFGDNAALTEAIGLYRRAMTLVPRDSLPLDWAKTQNNLGIALATLGERESGTAQLEEAVAAYREALEELTRERVPLDWATTQNNLGNALDKRSASGRAGRRSLRRRSRPIARR